MKFEAAVGAARAVDACPRYVPRMLPPARACDRDCVLPVLSMVSPDVLRWLFSRPEFFSLYYSHVVSIPTYFLVGVGVGEAQKPAM